MGEMTSRVLAYIVGTSLLIMGVVQLSELVHPSGTALGASSGWVTGFAAGFVVIGIGVIAAGRRIPKRARPKPLTLTLAGLASAAAPFVVWVAATFLAPKDAAVWGPIVAIGLFVMTVPGVGMLIGGLRRIGQAPAPPTTSRRDTGPRVKTRR